MSILTREDLETRITSGALSFDPPLDEFQLQGHTLTCASASPSSCRASGR